MVIWVLVCRPSHSNTRVTDYFSQMKSYSPRTKRSLSSMEVVSLQTPLVLTVKSSSDSPKAVYLSSISTELSWARMVILWKLRIRMWNCLVCAFFFLRFGYSVLNRGLCIAGEVVLDGTDFRNGAHLRFKADLFVPCGGRFVWLFYG